MFSFLFVRNAFILLVMLESNVLADGCCSMNYKECDVWWCGSTRDSCENCGGDDFTFLENGEVSGQCLKRWSGCKNNISGCCDGLVCMELSQWYSQCLPGTADDEEESPDEPPETPPPSLRPTTKSPTRSPSFRPTPSPVADPTPSPVADPPPEPATKCGCASCTEQVLDRLADGYKCGDRIDWVIDNTDLDEFGACMLVGGDEYPSICGPCDPNTCNGNNPSPSTSPPTKSPTDSIPVDNIDWDGSDLTLTHYWDCSGQSCDATTLSPWDYGKYRSPSGYQPQDPNDFGGPSPYGEKLWVTAAIMNIDQGSDEGCCGATSQGGCGNCILIQNPDSLRPDWSVMAMKKNTCGNCRSGPHADINVPGFDVLQYSLANICGDQPNTGLTKEESTVLGQWYQDYSNVADAGAARCNRLPQEYQKGCYLFSEWGWTGGTTSRAKYKVVDCPSRFREHIGSLFNENGVLNV